jgi:hypothetical protein
MLLLLFLSTRASILLKFDKLCQTLEAVHDLT